MLNKLESYVTLRRLANYGRSCYQCNIDNSKNANEINEKLATQLFNKYEEAKKPKTVEEDEYYYIEPEVTDNFDYKGYIDQYSKILSISIWKLSQELEKKGIKAGKGFSTIGTDFEEIPNANISGTAASDIFTDQEFFIPALNCLPKQLLDYDEEEVDMRYLKARFALQNRELVYMSSVFMSTLTDLMRYINKYHEFLIQDIETGKINNIAKIPEEIKEELEKKLSPNKERAKELREIFSSESDESLMTRLWKNMTMIITYSFGESSLYEEELRKFSGNDVVYCHEIYASMNSLIGTIYDEKDKSYMLAYDAGYFEFSPMEKPDEIYQINDLEVGHLYEIIVTDGFENENRRTGDVVRVVGFAGQAPLIRFVYRKKQLINLCGAGFSIENIISTLKDFEDEIGIKAGDFSFCIDTNRELNRVILFVESEDALFASRYREVLSDAFNERLMRENEEYGFLYRTGRIGKAFVKVVTPNAYNQIRKMKIKKGIPISREKAVRFVDIELLQEH